MKSIRIAIVFAFVALAALPTFAQSTTINVPFSFDYGKQHFAAGIYTVSMQNKDILTLTGGNNRVAWGLIQASYDPTSHAQGCVAFHKYGNRYFLTAFSPAHASLYVSVSESESERRVLRDFTVQNLTREEVQLASLR
jgi:hypothetical protein